MKQVHRQVNLAKLCRLLGVTRQAYYQHFWRKEDLNIEQELVIQEVLKIRQNHRHIGGRKLYEILQPFLLEHQIKMGRDALFDLLSAHQLLVRKKKRKVYTTHSFHWLRKYPNLIKDLHPVASNQLWVSDITYWKYKQGYLYLSLITDAYSHKIVGYHLAQSLEAVETVKALKMALKELNQLPKGLIHHSDRGIQYCSAEYVKLLKNNNILISMTENGDPLENAIAERINGIIKQEYLDGHDVKSITQARLLLKRAVALYNKERPHMSIGYLAPELVHQSNIKTERMWKNYKTRKNKFVNLSQDLNPDVNRL